MSLEDADALLGALPRLQLSNAIIQERSRTCPAGDCGPWSEPTDWYIRYLTYSGGVTTRYKNFLADMNLVLFDDGGTTRLSMQHVTFPDGNYDDDQGVLYDFPPEVVSFAYIRAYDASPDNQYDYQDLELYTRYGTLVLGDGCARWTAVPWNLATEPYTRQYGVLFTW